VVIMKQHCGNLRLNVTWVTAFVQSYGNVIKVYRIW